MHINEVDTHILPVRFVYHAPTSLNTALELLSKHGGNASLLAGGTDLLVQMKQRLVEPTHIINIKRIGELNGIEEAEDGVRIGAATRLRDLERSDTIKAWLPLLHDAVRSMASVQIRNMATVGGNLCNASPAADSAVALIALSAKARIVGPTGARKVDLEEFFVGPGQTVLGENELLTGFFIPYPEPDSGSTFLKLGRTSLDIATVNVATVVRAEGEIISDCRVAMGAVAPTPIRLHGVEEFLGGKEATAESFEEAADMGVEDINPITDVRATAEYRRAASRALIQDALSIACSRAREARR